MSSSSAGNSSEIQSPIQLTFINDTAYCFDVDGNLNDNIVLFLFQPQGLIKIWFTNFRLHENQSRLSYTR